MKELLQKWSELEPEKCTLQDEVHGYGDAHYYWSSIDNFISVPDSESFDEMTSVDRLDYLVAIQGAVQEAIEARGWIHSCGINGSGRYWGWVQSGEEMDETVLSDISIAEALLSAYLKALEQQTRVK